jgi:hypothetical protein
MLLILEVAALISVPIMPSVDARPFLQAILKVSLVSPFTNVKTPLP